MIYVAQFLTVISLPPASQPKGVERPVSSLPFRLQARCYSLLCRVHSLEEPCFLTTDPRSCFLPPQLPTIFPAPHLSTLV
ncbi:hypothetical protein ABKN59_004180 [Abortiporus biennis]